MENGKPTKHSPQKKTFQKSRETGSPSKNRNAHTQSTEKLPNYHTSDPSQNRSKQPKKVKGLPKVSPKAPHKSNRRKHSKRKSHKGQKETNFTTLNTTNVRLIKEYFSTISPHLYDTLARNGQYVLYQYEGRSYEIHLVPTTMSTLVKQLNRHFPMAYAGVHLGFMKRRRTHTHFERAFYLSYEGGRFLFNFVRSFEPELQQEIQTVVLDEEGEKAFLYGRNIDLDDIISETDHLVKKKMIFVLDQEKEYIGLALLMVKQAGSEIDDQGMKTRDDYSRSPHFKLYLLNLSDAGQYLRKGS